MAVASYSVNAIGENQNKNVWELCECWLHYRDGMEDSRLHAVTVMDHKPGRPAPLSTRPNPYQDPYRPIGPCHSL